MKHPRNFCLPLALFAITATGLLAQDLPLTQGLASNTIHPIDPTYGVIHHQLESAHHKPLPEEYIWTEGNATTDDKVIYTFPGLMEQTEPHFFRRIFTIAQLPPAATLYIAGPRSVRVWLNGQLAESVESDTSSPLGVHVFTTDVRRFLHAGRNTIAIEAVRGRGVTGFANSALVRQQTFGQVLVAKLLPAAPGVNAKPLMLTNKQWKSSLDHPDGWEKITFDDSSWRTVQSIGGIESSIELFQWNADAGLYEWPGYDGISSFLAHKAMPVAKVLATYAGRGTFSQLESITSSAPFEVTLPASTLTNAESPSLFLDFGRELTGRLEIVSDSDAPAVVTMQLGESESEALKVPFLGINQISIPPHGTGHSPKTAFRYAKIAFVGGGPKLRIRSVGVDHIYYPVKYTGAFESSDPMLNRIWEVGAYTTHLCMQDGVWDASKRDRGRWMGDTDIIGRVVADVFDDRYLMEDTLDRLLGPAPVKQHVNGIPGYSAFWFTGVTDYYRHTGAKEFLAREHDRMLQLLSFVDTEFDASGIYANTSKVWLYVDWSPDLNGDTPETRRATTLEYYRAYHEAAWLLHELGDETNSIKYAARAATIRETANKLLVDPTTGTYGDRWQTNAAAVFGGVADPSQYPKIWDHVFSTVGHVKYNAYIISPYYNYYVIGAMARTGHRREALDWIRQYWGGMLTEGATSFWEGYDPSWYKEDFHSSLQADNRSGYFVSLAHGWSTGPTAWMMEELLGIQPTGAGFSTIDIRPDLAGLDWVKGSEPTPRGLVSVEAHRLGDNTSIQLDLPARTTARVSVPVISATAKVLVNGRPFSSESSENNTRAIVTLSTAGHYELRSN